MPLLDKPKVNSISASIATIHDLMPRNAMDFSGGPEIHSGVRSRSFACVKRYGEQADKRQNSGHSALISIDQGGTLFYHVPDVKSATSWSEERFELSELKGSRILRIQALEYQDLGMDVRVFIVALDSSGQPQLIMLAREAQAKTWRRVKIAESSKLHPDRFVEENIGGVVARNNDVYFYASPRSGRHTCMPIVFKERGDARAVLVAYDEFDEVVHKHAHIVNIRDQVYDDLHHVHVEENTVCIALAVALGPYQNYEQLIVSLEAKKKLLSTKLRDGKGQIFPVTDSFGLCRGLLIFDGDGKALHCAIGETGDIISETSLNVSGGPEKIEELVCCYSIVDSSKTTGTLNVYARDERDMVWHTAWKAFDHGLGESHRYVPEQAAQDIKWQATGHRAINLDVVSETRETPFVFVGKRGGSVERLSRIEGGDWVSTKIAAGLRLEEAAETLVHAIQISTVNVLSHPVPGTELEVSTDKTVLVEHEGEFFQLGPDRPAILKTGPSGGLRLKIRAEDNLEAPMVTVKHKDLPQAFRYHPQDGALRRLAGLAPDPGPNPDFAMTAERLRKENLIPANMEAEDADKFVSLVKGLAASALRKGADAAPGNRLALRRLGAENASPISFTVSREPDGFSVRSVTPADPEWSGVAPQNDIASLWSDLWAWVSKGWETVQKMTATIVDNVVRLAVKVGDTVRTFVADTARRIGDTITSFFQQVSTGAAEAAKKLVSFLAERLGWQDVIRVKNLTRLYTLRFMTDLETIVGVSLPNLVSAQIAKARKLVEERFDEVIGKLDPTPKVPLQKDEADRRRLHDNGIKTFAVQDSMPDRPIDRELFTPSAALSERVNTLVSNFSNETNKSLLTDTLKQIDGLITDGMTLDKLLPVLVSVLKLLKPLVRAGFDAADVVQTAIFEFISDIIGLVRKAMTTPITALGSSFNWLNTFYKSLSGGKDLDLLDLGCLLFVAPGVMFHHLTSASDLMTSEVSENEVETVLSGLPRFLKDYALADDRDSSTCNDGADHASSVWWSSTANAFFEKHRKTLLMVRAIYRFASGASIVLVNGFKMIRASGKSFSTHVETLISLANFAMLGLTIAETVFTTGKKIAFLVERGFMKTGMREPLFALAIGAVLACVGVAAYIYNKAVDKFIERIEKGVPLKDLISATISYLGAVGATLFLIVRSVFLNQGEEDEAEAREANLSLGSSIVGIIQGHVQFGIPAGGLLTQLKEPTLASIGSALMGIQTIADPLLCVVDGGLINARAR